MTAPQEIETICPANRKEWRQWLQKNHNSAMAVWVIYYKIKSTRPTLSWSDAVDEALCFGWIDSKRKSIDEEKFIQFFSKRKARSTWSKVNKEKIETLIKEGKMTKAGLESIEIAKQNGSWQILDEVEETKIPDDLANAFSQYEGSQDFFDTHSKSVKKMMLQWIVLAKKPETRQKRIQEIAEHSFIKKKPKQF